MSNIDNGCAACTGAMIGRGKIAVRRHITPNRITKARRRFVFMRIDETALAMIEAEASKWRVSRGEIVSRIIRTVENRKAVAA